MWIEDYHILLEILTYDGHGTDKIGVATDKNERVSFTVESIHEH